MDQDQINVLWSLFGFIGQRWGTAADCQMPQQQFQQALQWQMQRDPSYLGYYRQTIAEYKVLLQQYHQPTLALAALIDQNPYAPSNPSAVANYVLLEFMRWNIAFGGFKTFGYMNYNGWMGGGSFLNQPPPYRALSIQLQSQPAGGDHGQGA
ncbi:hypothetical protein [Pseudomonas sp. MPB26]|uniref:hypothetical protein n=1 Tax=Pseudomonas sp. MPB26 TaxID=3388491 RepID=UPI0039851AD7